MQTNFWSNLGTHVTCTKELLHLYIILRKLTQRREILNLILVVLCPECHRRAEFPNHFERKITTSQLRKYKKDWTEFCKAFPTIAFEKPVIAYCFLNEPRINMIFNQLANPVDNSKVMELKRETIEANVPSFFRRMPLERMMQIVINNLNFINLETIERKEKLLDLEKLEGFPVCGTRDFYSNRLKSPQFYQKHGITDMPYIYNKRKMGNKIIKTKVTYDPKYVISMTAYVELSGIIDYHSTAS